MTKTPPERVVNALNESQRRYVSATFAHVDELLEGVLRNLDAPPAPSPFSRHVSDATPVQRKVAGDYIARARELMRAALKRHSVAPTSPTVSGVWASRTLLNSAMIAIEELGPRYLRGYGELPEETSRDVDGTVASLLELLGQMELYLAQGAGGELQKRLQRLDGTRGGQALLAELARILTAHGLTEFRSTLEILAERLESRSLEVGVFGRVSSGKSSLLNYVLGTNALPVGVTPVTAVPTRILYAAKAWGRAWFAEAAPEIFHLGRLAEFASEHQNPANRRRVTRLEVELPAALLKDRVVFIDAPGSGSLATAGAQAAAAWLPRCDLGIVLVDAASALNPEDVATVDALLRAGASVMALLAKADLLSEEDRWRAVIYTRGKLTDETGTEVPVYPVSVVEGAASLCDRWIEEALLPRLRDRQRLAEISLRRKLAALKAEVMAALERRVSSRHEPGAREGIDPAEEALSRTLAELDGLRRDRAPLLPEPHRLAAEALVESAHNAAVIWKQNMGEPNDMTALLAASLEGRAARAAEGVHRSMVKMRASLANVLAAASPEPAVPEEEELPRPAGMPSLHAEAVVPRTVLLKPFLVPPLTKLLARHILWRLERGGLHAKLADALASYDRRLQEWRVHTLGELRRGFVARADRLRGRAGATTGREEPGGSFISRAALLEDLEKLRGFEEKAET